MDLKLPFGVDNFGRIATTSVPEVVGRQHLTSFLLTQPGERVMRPDFGSPIRETVFEPLDEVTAALLVTRVQERVETYVRTARLVSLGADVDSEQSALRLTVEFALAVGAGEGVTRSTTITLGGGE